MNFFRKLSYLAATLAVMLLAACGGGGGPGVASGTLPPVLLVTTLAGSAGQSGSTDATGSAARFKGPFGVATDTAGNIYVADFYSCIIRKITPAGVVSTLAGQADSCDEVDGTGSAARFNRPMFIVADTSGNLYVTDVSGNTIRKITPAGVVTTLAGSAGQSGSTDGNGTAARFSGPRGIALDASSNIYVVDDRNYTIRKIDALGNVTTLAGAVGQSGSTDGTGGAARFNRPEGVATDAMGNVYVADYANSTIRKITPAGVVTTLAGAAGQRGSTDGTGTDARFGIPAGIAVDADGNVYATDILNHTIRKITPEGVVTTLAGAGGQRGSTNGAGAKARFNGPYGLAIDPDGNMYAADSYNYTIRKFVPGYTIGGKVTGLDVANNATVVLKDVLDYDTETLVVNANGSFTFELPNAKGGSYGATVQTQPAGQTCIVTSGSGTIADHVSNIDVQCTGNATTAYALSGSVSGLAANTSVVLQNSNGETVTVTDNVAFAFKAKVAAGNAYAVTVKTQPSGQTCSLTGGSGTAAANVTTIAVSCAPISYNINVAVSGLSGTLALQNNGGDNLSISANGNFNFATQVAFNGTYNVTVLTQPAGQTCVLSSLSGTSGTMNGAVNISATCTTNTYSIGGSVSGLSGTLVLQNNSGNNLSLSADGSFTFTTPIAYNGAYNVTVLTQPAGQTCTVSSGSGTVTANVSNVAVNCVASGGTTFTIGGVVNGLNAVTLELQNNGGDTLQVFPGAPGAQVPFPFATPVAGAYDVTVLTNPAGQSCSVTSGGSGTATANVSDVVIDCN